MIEKVPFGHLLQQKRNFPTTGSISQSHQEILLTNPIYFSCRVISKTTDLKITHHRSSFYESILKSISVCQRVFHSWHAEIVVFAPPECYVKEH